ncbi:DUF3857 domain-containing protein [Geothrix limicola]|nr:DUF3857 domain-containing protein [Geothrix limicola]
MAEPLTGEPAALLAASARQPQKEGAAVVELLEEHVVRVDAEGRREIRYRYVFRIDRESAIESWSSVSAEWSPWFEARPEIQARVITPDGQVHLLDPKTLGEYGAEDPDATVFGDRRHLRGPLPKLSKGALAEVFIRYWEKEPFSKAGVRGRIGLIQNVPVTRTRVELTVPSKGAFAFKLVGLSGVQADKRTNGEWTTVSLDLGPQEAVKEAEAHLPLDLALTPELRYSTVPSWSASAREYAEIVQKQIEGVDLSAWVSETLGGATQREEKIAKILQRLHRDIRYTGVEFRDAAIVPARPSETLRRGFGDCKDKSTLLICLLRAAGIPAEVALLRSGTAPDVDPDMPGSSGFNHAIVYLPGEKPAWIDATAEFTRAGAPVYGVEGRLAMVASPETVGLTRIPELRAEENWQREIRDVTFSESGPGTIRETTRAGGWFEERYRSDYSRNDEKKVRESLLEYAKNSFTAKSIGTARYTEGRDLSRPFELDLEIQETPSVRLDAERATVAVNPWSMVTRLLRALKDGQKEGDEEPVRKADFYLPEPYTQELIYKIHTPLGYELDVLPSDRVIPFGPGALSMTFKKGPQETVLVEFRMSVGNRRWTAGDVNAALKGLKAFGDEKVLQVAFNQVGESHLAAGRIKEAIAEFRRLVQARPGSASPHTRIARAFLAAGLGEAARQEARNAIHLDPKSAPAQEALGWILQHDLVGRRFGKGWDLKGATEAYRQAKTLDPKSYSIRGDLAILLEYNAEGVRYGAGADLDASIREYQEIRDELKNHNLDKNLVLTLAKRGRYQESVDLARGMAQATLRDTWLVVGLVTLQGVDQAIAEASRLFTDPAVRRAALVNAADQLIRLRKYPEATRLLQEGSNGSDQMSQIRSRVELLSRVRKVEPDDGDRKDPAGVVRQFMLTVLRQSTDLKRLRGLFSPAIVAQLDQEKATDLGGTVRNLLRGVDLPPEAMGDLAISLAQMAVDGNDSWGYRVQVRGLGTEVQAFFVTPTPSGYRVVGSTSTFAPIGLEALWSLDQGNLPRAQAWLDQARQLMGAPPADDPLAGPLFPRFWSKGQGGDAKAARLAAAILLLGENDSRMRSILETARKDPANVHLAEWIDTASLVGAMSRNDWPTTLPLSETLLKAHPTSLSAAGMRMGSLVGNQRWDELLRFSDAWSKEYPDQRRFREGQYMALKGLGRRMDMEQGLQDQIDRGRAEGMDYNNLAWSHVVRESVTSQSLELIRTATQGHKNASDMHTLATILAELGRTSEAKEALTQEIELKASEEVGTNEWYVLGRIAEHLGVPEVARTCFERAIAQAPADKGEDPDSCRALALRRLQGVKGA